MCTRASVMAGLPVSPAKSPSSASASEFTPPSASSGLFCSQVLDSGFPCGRPTQHGHPNRCTRHAGGRGEGPTVYALGAQPQLAAVKAPVVPQGADPRVPGTLGAPESYAGGPGYRGVPATPGGPRFLGVPELDAGGPGYRGVPATPGGPRFLGVPGLDVGSPDFRGAPAPNLAAAEFQRGEAEHGAGDPGLRGVPAPGDPGSLVLAGRLADHIYESPGRMSGASLPTMQLTHFPMTPGDREARGAPVGASTPGAVAAAWTELPIGTAWAAYPGQHDWSAAPLQYDAFAAGVQGHPASWTGPTLPSLHQQQQQHFPPENGGLGAPQGLGHGYSTPGPQPHYDSSPVLRRPEQRQADRVPECYLSPGVAPYRPKMADEDLDTSVRGSNVTVRTSFKVPASSEAPKSYYTADSTGLRAGLSLGGDVAMYVVELKREIPSLATVLSIEPEPVLRRDSSPAEVAKGRAWYDRLEKVHYPQYDNPLVVYGHQCGVVLKIIALTVDVEFGMAMDTYRDCTPFELIGALKHHADQQDPAKVATVVRLRIRNWERDPAKTLQANLNDLERMNESIRRLGRNTVDADDILLSFRTSIETDGEYSAALDTADVLGFSTAQQLVKHLSNKESSLRQKAAKSLIGGSLSAAAATDGCSICTLSHSTSDCFGNPDSENYKTDWYPASAKAYLALHAYRVANASKYKPGANRAPTEPKPTDTKTVMPDGSPRSRQRKPRDKERDRAPRGKDRNGRDRGDRGKDKSKSIAKDLRVVANALRQSHRDSQQDSSDGSDSDGDNDDDDSDNDDDAKASEPKSKKKVRTTVRRNGAGNGGLKQLFASSFMVMGMLSAALGSSSVLPERVPREPDVCSDPDWGWPTPAESDRFATVSATAAERLPPKRFRSKKGWSLMLSDTGASHTVVPTKTGVHDYAPCRIPIKIANGTTVYTTGRGFRYLQPRDNPDVLLPTAVLICAAIQSPILSPHSVCHYRDDRGTYHGNGNNFTAFGARGGFTLADGTLVRTQTRHKLPWLAGRFVDPPETVLDSIASVRDVSHYDRCTDTVVNSDGQASGLSLAAADVQWQSDSKAPGDHGSRVSRLLYETHVRLGHCSFETAVKVLEMGGIKVSARDKRLACEVCSRAKLPRRGAKKGAHLLRTPATEFGEVLHLDLLEMAKSRYGRKFALVIVDDFSGWLTTIPIARKSDTTQAFTEYLDNHALGRSPSEVISHQIHSDNDAVFRGKKFHDLCDSRGARQTFSAPYHANGNSRAEQGVKRAKAVCYTLLQDGKLKSGLWEEAMVHGVNMLNRLPTSFNPNEASPLEMLIGAQAGRKEGLHFLDQCLPWGVEVDVLRPTPASGKRSRHGIYLGTNPRNHSARVLCEDTGRVCESVDYKVHWYDHEGVSRYDRSRPLGDMMIAPEPLKRERHHGLLPSSPAARTNAPPTTSTTATIPAPTSSSAPRPRRVARLRQPTVTTRSKPPVPRSSTSTSAHGHKTSPLRDMTTATAEQTGGEPVHVDVPRGVPDPDVASATPTAPAGDPGPSDSPGPELLEPRRDVPGLGTAELAVGDPGPPHSPGPEILEPQSDESDLGATSAMPTQQGGDPRPRDSPGPVRLEPRREIPGVPLSDRTVLIPNLEGPADDAATALQLSAPPGVTVDGFYPGDHVLFRTGHTNQGTSGHIVGSVDLDNTSVLLPHGGIAQARTSELRFLGPDMPIMALALEPNSAAVAYSVREAGLESEVQHEYLQTAAEYSANDPWRDRPPHHVSSAVLEDGTVAGGVLPINGLVSRYSAVCAKATSARTRVRSTLGMVVPRTWAEAMAQPEAEDWRKANATEMDCHQEFQTFRLRRAADMPRRCRAVKLKPVFRIKTTRNNLLDKFRLRWVYPGYRAIPGRNVFETYTPTMHLSTFRTLLAYWVPRGLHSRHLDLTTAFLHAPLEEEFYAEPPPYLDGVHEHLPGWVVEIRKSLYGIPQSSRNLYGILKIWFESVGFKTSTADPAFFYGHYKGVFITIGLYCDDIAIMTSEGNEATVDALVADMQTKFKVKDEGQLDFYLGFGITHMPDGSVYLDQSKAAEDLLKKQSFVGGGSGTGPSTPLPPNVNLSAPPTAEEAAAASALPFRQVVGAVMWLIQGSRPSLAYAGSVLCRRMSSWGKVHWNAASAALRHLRGHRDFGIYFPRHPKSRDILSGWCDSSHQDDKSTGRSTGGHVVYLNGAPVAWKAALSKVVCGSTAYSEFCAIAEAIKEIRVAAKVCAELGIPQAEVRLLNDNKPAVLACSNEIPTGLHRHVAGRFFYAREACLPTPEGPAEIDLAWINTDAMTADIFTKSLDGKTFLRHRGALEQPLPPNAVTPGGTG